MTTDPSSDVVERLHEDAVNFRQHIVASHCLQAIATIERLSAELEPTDERVEKLAALNPLYGNGEHIALNIRMHVRAILAALSNTADTRA